MNIVLIWYARISCHNFKITACISIHVMVDLRWIEMHLKIIWALRKFILPYHFSVVNPFFAVFLPFLQVLQKRFLCFLITRQQIRQGSALPKNRQYNTLPIRESRYPLSSANIRYSAASIPDGQNTVQIGDYTEKFSVLRTFRDYYGVFSLSFRHFLNQ